MSRDDNSKKFRGTFNVALLQMSSCGLDQDANRNKGIEFCKKAKEQGADLVLFPELWNVGYALKDMDRRENAIDQKTKFFLRYKDIAKSLNLAVAITYLERYQAGYRNVITLIDRFGEIKFTYAKLHTCSFSLESFLTPGGEFFVTNLNTEKGDVKVGSMICFDREFPESARILMLRGAEVILVPNACEMEQNRIESLRAHAFENMVGIALTNYAFPQENGHSVAFDGMAFNEEGCSCDMKMLEADESEGIWIAKFDVNASRLYRKNEPWGSTLRRPQSYTDLVDTSRLTQSVGIHPDCSDDILLRLRNMSDELQELEKLRKKVDFSHTQLKEFELLKKECMRLLQDEIRESADSKKTGDCSHFKY